jgi:hypothetical protein
MPDRYGFNHLGDDVRCIDCPTGGPLGRWPEHKRAAHAHTHQRHIDSRPRSLLAAADHENTSEVKEATKMQPARASRPSRWRPTSFARRASRCRRRRSPNRCSPPAAAPDSKARRPRRRSVPCSPWTPRPAAPSSASTKAPTPSPTCRRPQPRAQRRVSRRPRSAQRPERRPRLAARRGA